MTKPVLIMQNDAREGAGLLASLMKANGVPQEAVLGDKANYTTLKAEDFGALVILGGAQSAYETDAYPYLKQEMALCKDFIGESKPVVGFCLGAQIMACALGGRVYPGKQKEIGWYDLHLTGEASADALFSGYPQTLLAYHFHGDVIELPPGATNLAYSELTKCQLFRFGNSAYGFQYHAEADLPLVKAMCVNNASYMADNGFDRELIACQSEQHASRFEQANEKVFKRWLNFVPTT
jgi:GMP synthase (glutamine-hydrolysing)